MMFIYAIVHLEKISPSPINGGDGKDVFEPDLYRKRI